MAQSDAPRTLSPIVRSLREACLKHVPHDQYVSVSGFVTIDIDGCRQERLVLSEFIQAGKLEENAKSFPLKSLVWTNIGKLPCHKPDVPGKTCTDIRSDPNKKKHSPGIVGKRTDLKNLTFTLVKNREAQTQNRTTSRSLPPSSLLLNATLSAEAHHNHTENKQIGLPENKLTRIVNGSIEKRRRLASTSGKPLTGMRSNQRRLTCDIPAAPPHSVDLEKAGRAGSRGDRVASAKEDALLKATNLDSETFNRCMSRLSDSASGLDSVLPDFLVGHTDDDDWEEVGEESPPILRTAHKKSLQRCLSNNINVSKDVQAGANISGKETTSPFTSTNGASRSCSSGPGGIPRDAKTPQEEAKSVFKNRRLDRKISSPGVIDGQAMTVSIKTKDIGAGRGPVVSQSELSSPCQCPGKNSSSVEIEAKPSARPSMSSLQSVMKKKRLRKFIDMFR